MTHEGKTVMLNFTALWSPYAKWNLKHAIDTPAVLTAVEQNDAVPMVADWTDQRLRSKPSSTR